jgi:Transposase, Mutator family
MVEMCNFTQAEEDPMAEERLALTELLEKASDGDFLRSVAEAVLQLLMEVDVDGLIGAGRYESSGERATWRNGFRDRVLDTRLGRLQRERSAPSSTQEKGASIRTVAGTDLVAISDRSHTATPADPGTRASSRTRTSAGRT